MTLHFLKNDDCETNVNKYNYFSGLVAKHAPVKTIHVPACDPNTWMTKEILSAKHRGRKD